MHESFMDLEPLHVCRIKIQANRYTHIVRKDCAMYICIWVGEIPITYNCCVFRNHLSNGNWQWAMAVSR